MKFKKPTQDQLDILSTIFGGIAGIAELLIACKRVSNEDGQLVAGLALIVWSFFSNKPPRIVKLRGFPKLLDELTEE
ncbi:MULTISPECIES: hypothetical protein [unclassified Microcoleus]|uniref:hypothetical protein n=1 Tax=unclassified Microcoleus TaxID=2642155 RepID=UPI002FD263B3